MKERCVVWHQHFLLVLMIVLPFQSVASVLEGELLVFPFIQTEARSGNVRGVDGGQYDGDIAVDLFYSRDNGRFLSLVEFFLGQDEQELERFQIGFSVRGNTQAWFGRYHSPLTYWNTAYHHGRFFQTTITNPAITDFEDEGGPLPSHLSGFKVATEVFHGDKVYRLDAGIGLGPSLSDGALEPLDLLRPQQGKHSLSGAMRLNMESSSGAYQAGLSGGFAHIDRSASDSGRIMQTVGSGYVRWNEKRTMLLSEIVAVRNAFEGAGGGSNVFVSAYLQGEFRVWERNIIYLRLEDTWNDRKDRYLKLLNDFVDQRQLLGMRFALGNKQVLNLEYSRNHLSNEYFGQWALQWSAIFP